MNYAQHFIPGDDEDETTMAAPRFDVEAERAAQPVVPLNGLAPGPPTTPRPWPFALILLFSLLGGAAGFVALGLYQRGVQQSSSTPSISLPSTPPSTAVAKEKAMIIVPPATEPETDPNPPERTEEKRPSVERAPTERDASTVEEKQAPRAARPTVEPAAPPQREAPGARKTTPQPSEIKRPQEVRKHHDGPQETKDHQAHEGAQAAKAERPRQVESVREIFEGRRSRPRETSRGSVDRVREIFEGSRPR